VKFHWLPKYNYSSEVDISTPPKSSESSDSRPKPKLYNFYTDQVISSGQLISLTTDDPEERPLPHFALLEMQWMLQRVAAMSGAAEIYNDFNYNDDDAIASRYNCDPYKEDEWDLYTEDNSNSYEEASSPATVNKSTPPSSPLRKSLSPLPKSNIRVDYTPLRPAENSGIKTIGSSQGQ
jgi:hypothetical protein